MTKTRVSWALRTRAHHSSFFFSSGPSLPQLTLRGQGTTCIKGYACRKIMRHGTGYEHALPELIKNGQC